MLVTLRSNLRLVGYTEHLSALSKLAQKAPNHFRYSSAYADINLVKY
jgi:hypothetical protein